MHIKDLKERERKRSDLPNGQLEEIKDQTLGIRMTCNPIINGVAKILRTSRTSGS